ncbi:hypothetical protein G6653_04835 [Polynucleobacter paneuropaeus]|jgi:methionyl-tRNA formyltransferase|nr:hypothetical protein [Polynucleobacter paneuropaeus]MBT8610786.1 hypothetical protein [Polynucleobacter paneuropaeus]
MKILLIIQDDPFYLYDDIQILIDNKDIEIKGVAVLDQKLPSDSYFKLITRYLNIFGTIGTIKLTRKAIYLKYIKKRIIDNIFKKNNIKVLKPKNINNYLFIEEVNNLNIDLIISIACPQKISNGLLKCAKKGGINLHGGYLPDFPGVFTPFWNLLNESEQAGCTVHWINEQFDSGVIVDRIKFKINPKMSIMDIYSEISKNGMNLLSKSIKKIISNNYEPIANDYKKTSYNSFPTKYDRKLFKSKGCRAI